MNVREFTLAFCQSHIRVNHITKLLAVETHKTAKSKTKKNTSKPAKPKEGQYTKYAIAEHRERQFNELAEYGFKHLKHPAESIDFITEDSLRRALNQNNFHDIPDNIVSVMM